MRWTVPGYAVALLPLFGPCERPAGRGAATVDAAEVRALVAHCRVIFPEPALRRRCIEGVRREGRDAGAARPTGLDRRRSRPAG